MIQIKEPTFSRTPYTVGSSVRDGPGGMRKERDARVREAPGV